MYLDQERCATCGGKFDDTYKSEPYNTKMNPYRIAPDPRQWPYFCSERCRLLDLKRWLEEDYGLAREPSEDAEGRTSSLQDRPGAV